MEENNKKETEFVTELLEDYIKKYHWDSSSKNLNVKVNGLKSPVNSDELQALFTNLLGYNPKNILDIGCGTGRFLRGLPLFWQKIGIENQPEVAEIARILVDENTHIHHGNAEELPYDCNRFDVVTSFQVLEHVNDPELVIKEMFRVTKPGGLVYGELPNKWYPKESHIGLIYPQLMPMWLRKPYINRFAKININSEDFDYLRNINYLTPQQVLSMLRMYSSREIHLTPVRLEKRIKMSFLKPFAKVLGDLGSNIAGIDFVAIK